MDEFAEYIYQRRPEYRHLSTGDISAQKELRKHLKCKDFKWFMTAVAWDVPKYYPPVEPPPAAWGEVRNTPARSNLTSYPVCITLFFMQTYCTFLHYKEAFMKLGFVLLTSSIIKEACSN